MNNFYLGLPEVERNQSIHQLAPHPPLDVDNLVAQVWDRHWPKWRQPKSVSAKAKDWRAFTAAWQEQSQELELIARAQAGDQEHIATEKLDAVIVRRVARKRKGSWWLVPEELRGP